MRIDYVFESSIAKVCLHLNRECKQTEDFPFFVASRKSKIIEFSNKLPDSPLQVINLFVPIPFRDFAFEMSHTVVPDFAVMLFWVKTPPSTITLVMKVLTAKVFRVSFRSQIQCFAINRHYIAL